MLYEILGHPHGYTCCSSFLYPLLSFALWMAASCIHGFMRMVWTGSLQQWQLLVPCIITGPIGGIITGPAQSSHSQPSILHRQLVTRPWPCGMQTAHCKLKTENRTLHTAYCTLHTANYKLNTESCKLHTVRCVLQTRVIEVFKSKQFNKNPASLNIPFLCVKL